MISKHNAPHYLWGDQCDGWYLVNHQDLLIIHEKMPGNSQEKSHYHRQARQFFFVLSGILTMELEGVSSQLHPQQGIEIPAQAMHQARNDHADPVEFLVISQPSTRGDRIDQ